VPISGASIKWYYAGTSVVLPLTTPLHANDVFWAIQSTGNCESEHAIVTISNNCYSPYGTIFPFVHTNDDEYNNLFVTTAKLFNPPPSGTVDKVNYLRKQIPVQTVHVTYYDCENGDYIIGAPLNPGFMGATNNPGLPIQWSLYNISVTGTTDTQTITTATDCPTSHIGKYNFENIPAGDYILEISRPGFLIRYGEVEVGGIANDYLGHREILGGDVNGDGIVNAKDLSAIRPKMGAYGSALYNLLYDFDGNKVINSADINIIRLIYETPINIYEDTHIWLSH
jgi:hypothetical protein